MPTQQRDAAGADTRSGTPPPSVTVTAPPTRAPTAADTEDTAPAGDSQTVPTQQRGATASDARDGTDDRDDSGNGDGQRRGCKPNLSFRFPDTGKNFPEPTSAKTETCLQKLKNDILRTYKNHKVTDNNTDSNERKLLKELANNDSIIIKQSDKCKGFVILDKPAYIEKVKDILNDRSNYDMIHKNPVPQVEARAKQTLLGIARGKLPEKTIKELTPGHSRTPVFYGLPKDHKPSVPLRPVVSACGGPTEKTSCLLERILKQLLKFVPTHLWDTKDFLKKASTHLNGNELQTGSIFFSIDVVNLYGSIPINEAIEAVREKLNEHGENIDTFGLTTDDISRLLEQSLGDNVFSFNNDYFRQKVGIAMGNPCAPPLAILFLDRFETKALANSPLKPAFLARYIDDYAGIWNHGQKALEEFVAFLNNQHSNLSFTMEYSSHTQGVPFLDTYVTVETRGSKTTLETELFIKPTNSGIILHSSSAHPKTTKHSIIRNMFHRAYNNSSSKEKETRSINKIWDLLRENGYPSKLLWRLLREVRQSRTGKGRGKRNNVKGRNKNEADSLDGFLTLPYIDEQLSRKVKSIVRKSNLHVHIAWKNENKLKNTLTKSAICKPRCPGGQKCNLCMSDFKGDCTRKNVVYKIHCKICQKEGIDATYVGESMRPIRLRYNEHRRDAINRTPNTPLGDHFLREHTHNTATDSDILQLRILYRAQDHPDRKIAESILIRSETPTLNIQGSSWPIMRVV